MWAEVASRYFNLLPCPRCGDGDGGGAGRFCRECLIQLPLLPVKEHCPGCGGTMDGPLAMCRACMEDGERPWQDAAAVMEYCGTGAELVRRFKSGGAPELARPLGHLAAETVRKLRWRADLIVPVPLRFIRRWRRSYNQSELFGRRLAAETGIPLNDLLIKLPGGSKQAGLTRSGRLRNRLRFSVNAPMALKGKNLILVDDIFTTGSTLTAAAEALRAAGAQRIFVLCCARTPWRM